MWGLSPHFYFMLPTIFVAIPNQGIIRTELNRTLNLWIGSGKYDICLYTNDDHPLDKARNICVQKFIESGYEYLFWIDSDMNCPLDTLDKLLAADKSMISAVCLWWNYSPESDSHNIVPMAVRDGKTITGQGCTEVDRSNVNCTLIKRAVLESVGIGKFYYDFANPERTELNSSEDYTFCDAVRAAGYKIYVDFDIVTSHYKVVDILDIFKLLTRALEMERC